MIILIIFLFVLQIPSKEKPMAVVGKCCPIGQNMSLQEDAMGNFVKVCAPSDLVFQPYFYDYNGSMIWAYDMNVWETIVSNPCEHGR